MIALLPGCQWLAGRGYSAENKHTNSMYWVWSSYIPIHVWAGIPKLVTNVYLLSLIRKDTCTGIYSVMLMQSDAHNTGMLAIYSALELFKRFC